MLLPTAAEPGQPTAQQKDATTDQDDGDPGAQRWFHGTTLDRTRPRNTSQPYREALEEPLTFVSL